MAQAPDKVTRFAADLVEAAAAEGARQSRSARQQLDHWVRVGRAVASTSSAARHRVEQALAGRLPLADLDSAEEVAFNAEVAAAIEEDLATADYGATLASEGIVTVALDEHGRIVQYRPDGSTTVLSTVDDIPA